MKKKIIFFILYIITTIVKAQPGSNDATFNIGTGFNNVVYAIVEQPDGKIIIGGAFMFFNNMPCKHIIRLNIDGTVDASFNIGIGFSLGVVRALCLQPDGKIIVGGHFTQFNNVICNNIVRLNTDGSLDTSFSPPGTGFDNAILTLSIQPDGKIVVGGMFKYFNGISQNRILRLNADGSLDTNFDSGDGFSDAVSSLFVQTDGKIVVGGYFWSFNGIPRKEIARLNTNGNLDTSFNPLQFWSIQTIYPQPDGKIIIGGSFTYFNTTFSNNIARLNIDGTLDTSFDPGKGFNYQVQALTLQPDGKIIVGGIFTSFNENIPRGCIARLNSDGSLDMGFNPGTGFNTWVLTLFLQSDGKILVGGLFESFNNISRNHIARLNGGESPSISITNTPFAVNTIYGTPSSSTNFIVSGTRIINNITITAPTGFEISLTPNSDFANNLVISGNGTIPNTTVYIRLKGTTLVGTYNGDIVLTSSGAASVNVPMPNSTVSPKALNIIGLTGNNKVYNGNTIALVSGTAILVGIITGDNVILLGTPVANFDNVNIGINKPISISGYTLTGTASSNYTLTQITNLTANITPKNTTISGLTANDKIYDGNTTATLSGTPNLLGIIPNDDVILSGSPNANFNNSNVGINKPVIVTGYTLTGTASSNYTLIQPSDLKANINSIITQEFNFDICPPAVIGYKLEALTLQEELNLRNAGRQVSYEWSNGSTNRVVFIKTKVDEGNYEVFIKDGTGFLIKKIIFRIKVNCKPNLIMPTAFSPNGDGLNDKWEVYGGDFFNLVLTVYNRWGEIVFVSYDKNESWNGTYRGLPMPVGIYVWKASYQNSLEPNDILKTEGFVTIVR